MKEPKAQPLILGFTSWTLSMPHCGPIEYKATLSNGQALPRFMSFSPVTRQFVISQDQYMKPGQYIVRLQGKLRDFYLLQVALYNITVTCEVVKLKPASGGALRTFDLVPGAPSINF